MKLALLAVGLLVACGSSSPAVRPSPPTPASTVVAPVDPALLAQAGIDRATIRIAAISKAAASAAGDGWAISEAAEVPNEVALLALAARLCDNCVTT